MNETWRLTPKDFERQKLENENKSSEVLEPLANQRRVASQCQFRESNIRLRNDYDQFKAIVSSLLYQLQREM